MAQFANEFYRLSQYVYKTNVSRGFWDKPRNHGELIALMHSELSEALEAMRHGDHRDNHIPDFTGVEAELADVIIRIMDYSVGMGYDIGGAVEAKAAYNKSRPHMHGGKRF